MNDMVHEQRHDLPFIRGTYMGIDPSLNGTGLAILNQYVLRTWVLPSYDLRGMERLVCLRDQMVEVLSVEKPTVVTFEGYAMSRGNRAHQMGEWGGILRLMLWEGGYPLFEVTPGGLKKFVTGKGSGPKGPVMLGMYKRWGLTVEDEDECDATALALIGLYLNSPNKQQEATVPQREALGKVNVIRAAVRRRSRGLQRVVKGS